MNYKETKENFRCNMANVFSRRTKSMIALGIEHNWEDRLFILRTTLAVYIIAVFEATWRTIIKSYLPPNPFETETVLWKRWFCYIVAVEIIKR